MSNDSGNVILGTIIGAALGFAAGLLLAPAKGEETREMIGSKAGEAKDAISEAANKTMASLKEVREAAERALAGQMKSSGDELKKMKNDTAKAVKNA